VRWLVLGHKGMLGVDLMDTLRSQGREVVGFDREECDLLDVEATRAMLAEQSPDVVVNCAAWTDVDGAETKEELAHALNATVPRTIAEALAGTGARLVQISTDYVFGGEHSSPIAEDAQQTPESAYGRTKAAGEDAVRSALPDHHLVLRTAWLYGAHGPCFPRTIVKLARERGSLSVVDDQRGQPTWTRDLSDLIVRLIDADVPAGTYHGTAGGDCSWFDFARAAVASAGLDPEVISPTDTASFPRPAERPAYSVLAHDGLRSVGIEPIGAWDERWAAAADEVLAAQ
jgi:dTDP-4-dehydrorhamnose reductase